ncbi:hypothetical protein HCC61_28635 [Streptomyces sp. HNM0575]|uniref:hypothetical protein n=1 Tax=Streptomyces sp. HNM0575 TaxID=2716338 RepID=UPI00145F5A32|nr:hypothetical protein [Streptomyces sp. HNM0575]NLU76544.1 hypothetical protein [Streptomyces sp. HNM0575]
MNSIQEGSAVKPRPAFWYDLPYGYLQIDVYPGGERMEQLAREILALPEGLRDRADQVFRMYALMMWELQKHRVVGCALGLHPDGESASMSVLTVSIVEMQGVNPKAALTLLLASGAGETRETGVVPVELPCGTAFVTGTVEETDVPEPQAVPGEAPAKAPVWRGMVAIPDTRSSSVTVLQLVTPSLHLADEYRSVLLGVASTVTYTDPQSADSTGGALQRDAGAIAEAVRNDFG